MGLDIKTYWLTDRQSQCDFDFDIKERCVCVCVCVCVRVASISIADTILLVLNPSDRSSSVYSAQLQ
jgi:hypothetical protein